MDERDPIPLSALQHWCYCPRQCALIHVDQVYAENLYTLRGQAVHKQVNQPGVETRAGLRVERALPVWSDRLGLKKMFEHDRSAARGEMATRGLYVFKHASELGNAPAHALFDRLTVQRNGDDVARDFGAYSVLFDGQSVAVGEHTIVDLPNVTLIRRC